MVLTEIYTVVPECERVHKSASAVKNGMAEDAGIAFRRRRNKANIDDLPQRVVVHVLRNKQTPPPSTF